MPIFCVTTKVRKHTCGVIVEPGMSVNVVTSGMSNPVIASPNAVNDAFLRVYGIDIRRAGCLSMSCLDVERIG